MPIRCKNRVLLLLLCVSLSVLADADGERAALVKLVHELEGLEPLVAALPTAVAPSNAPKAGDWLTLIKGYAKDAGLVIGLLMAVVAFLWIAWISQPSSWPTGSIRSRSSSAAARNRS